MPGISGLFIPKNDAMLSQRNSWLNAAFWIVFTVTAVRLIGLRFSNFDLFVDESQYWLWGQNLDFGYYSKPPLIAWTIRTVTEIANSSDAFWVRMPAPLLHGATALILSFWASRQTGPHTAVWVAAVYVTLPIVAVGSAVISTDTIMAPFFALALLYHGKLIESGRVQHALLTGVFIGLAMMAKYAGVYFFLGAGLAAVFLPSYRISIANSAALVFAAILVLSPNIIWNISHDLTTLDHTLDNVDWVRGGSSGINLNFPNLAEFFFGQFLVMGPIFFATLILLIWKSPKTARGYLYLSLPIIVLVCFQALFSRAYANWAFPAYLAGTLAVMPWLLQNSRAWLWVGLAINAAFSVTLPVLGMFAESVSIDGDNPLLIRGLGRDEFSNQAFELARNSGAASIVTGSRDVLADLFITGRDQDIQIYSTNPKGRSKNYYQQNYPFVSDETSIVLFITTRKNVACNDAQIPELEVFDTSVTAYENSNFIAYLVTPECHSALR